MKAAFDARPAAAAYSKAFQRLRELPGFDQKLTLRAEAGSILKRWAGRTASASPAQTTYRARYRAEKRAFGYTNIKQNPYGISINTGRHGGFPGEVWYRTPGGKYQQAGVVSDRGHFTASWIHFRRAAWNNIRAGAEKYGQELAILLPQSQRSVGLARQSVIQIADELGIDLTRVPGTGISSSAVAKARTAIASNGRAYKNGMGYEGGDNTRSYVQLLNRLPYGIKIGMDRALASILAGRAKYIETSYAKGAFDSMKSVARAFPNILSTGGLSFSTS